MTTFVKDLRDRAMVCRNELARYQLRAAADSIVAALTYLHANPCDETLRALQCEWARALRIFSFADDGTDDNGGGARVRQFERKVA